MILMAISVNTVSKEIGNGYVTNQENVVNENIIIFCADIFNFKYANTM